MANTTSHIGCFEWLDTIIFIAGCAYSAWAVDRKHAKSGLYWHGMPLLRTSGHPGPQQRGSARFASVYRNFEDIDEFKLLVDEVRR